jgi:SAM-dependent methyltransferase
MCFALFMRLASRYHEPLIAARKRELFSPLRGRVLEIGAGHGVNIPYLHPDVTYTAYEPNRWLARPGMRIEKFTFTGELYDAIICSLVLCSVDHPSQVLADIRRSLAPGGQFVFIEHVAAHPGSPLHAAQQKWTPLWSRCAGGCHPNRDTLSMIQSAGFVVQSINRFDLPLSLASPHIAGVATLA